jgi:hypothetical protein
MPAQVRRSRERRPGIVALGAQHQEIGRAHDRRIFFGSQVAGGAPALQALDHQPLLPDRLDVGLAGDERDLGAGPREGGTDDAPQRSRPQDHDLLHAVFPSEEPARDDKSVSFYPA